MVVRNEMRKTWLKEKIGRRRRDFLILFEVYCKKKKNFNFKWYKEKFGFKKKL